jgi:isopenicillin N synthase-like dioxygenase
MQFDVGSGMGYRKIREPEGLTSFDELPIIDLSDIDSADETKLRAVASEIYDACTKVGFFYIKNHGIPKESVAAIKKEAERYFKGLSMEKKMELDREKSEFHLGYGPFEDAKNGGDKAHPYESVLIGREVAWDGEYTGKVDPKHDAINLLPKEEDLPGHRAIIGQYYGQMLKLSRKLARMFALSLELPMHFFDDKMEKPGCLLGLNYYAPKGEVATDVNSAILAHTDHELFTILLQSDGINALEVVNGDGVWVPAKPIPDTFVVNIGDALSIWTNNVFLSTLHRASNTTGAERYSIPFFFGPDYDAVMETLPSCISETRPMIYKPVTQAEHYLAKMNTAYGASTLVAA